MGVGLRLLILWEFSCGSESVLTSCFSLFEREYVQVTLTDLANWKSRSLRPATSDICRGTSLCIKDLCIASPMLMAYLMRLIWIAVV